MIAQGTLRRAAMAAALLLVPAAGFAADTVPVDIHASTDGPVGNITFTPDNRMIFSHHPFFEPAVRVAERLADGTIKPFPSAAWNTPRTGSDLYLDSVLGLRGDGEGIVWILDAGTRGKVTPKIVAWNTRNDRLERILYLPPPASNSSSFHNDLVVDRKHEHIFIADEDIGPGGDGSKAGLVVVDLRTGVARRVLQGHVSTLPEDVPITVEGKALTVPGPDGKPRVIKVGADGIAADHAYEWLYFGPLNGRSLYRVPIAALIDGTLAPDQLAAKVERYSEKPNNGGLAIDAGNNLYFTEVETRSIGVIDSQRRYRRLGQHDQMLWPDGVSSGPDGYMYVSAAQIPLAPVFNDGKDGVKAPYLIFRFKPLAAAALGH